MDSRRQPIELEHDMTDDNLTPPPPPVAPEPAAATPPPPAYAPPAYTPPAYAPGVGVAPPKTLSLIGMIVGIIGVVAFGWFVPASIAALVLGYMGKKREGAPAKGFWLTAIITGWVGVALTVLVVGGVILIAVLGAASGYNSYNYNN
jgi:hypothetical protein